ncbi:MAG TPA: nuclear transport factor 2 family protein [Candidatus Aquilonibacter sp.]|nr:nuclear transport factor 2 family protein [Candidatus Aquilonibacter sp.]
MIRLPLAIPLLAAFSLSGAWPQQSVPPPTPAGPDTHTLLPFNSQPAISPGALELVKLEGDFENAVASGGGKAFASWFADDGVTLNNGQPAVRGQRAIAAQATWDPKQYQLTWYAEGAQMGPGGDTGFTWGHYEARGKDPKGNPVATSGRYITFWKKVKGHWKVALDASANDAPAPLQP